eukprot:7221948-Prymnesium_polylepis.2
MSPKLRPARRGAVGRSAVRESRPAGAQRRRRRAGWGVWCGSAKSRGGGGPAGACCGSPQSLRTVDA